MRRALVAASVLVVLALTGQAATAAAPGVKTVSGDHGLFLNVLPSGQGHSVTTEQALRYELTGQYPPHFTDQLEMYNSLPVQSDRVTDANLTNWFKPETFGIDPADIESSETPREGVIIARDRFGVPHVFGATRQDAEWGAGYVTAEDRLFMADTLRHVGRGRLSEFLGPTPQFLAMDRANYLAAGYSEEELNQQVNRMARFGPIGQEILLDGQAFVDGINARIQADEQDPSLMPAEYPALQLVPRPWIPADLAAVAIVIQAQFAGGGGGELNNATLLSAARDKLGSEAGTRLFSDLREANDPAAPVSAPAHFPEAGTSGPVDPAAVAMPDPGSLRSYDPLTVIPPAGPPSAPGAAGAGVLPSSTWLNPLRAFQDAMAAAGYPMPRTMSNWLGVTGAKSADGHPIAVMGPQVSYYIPQILMDIDLHAPGLDASGATFPGISLYVLLGRGPDFAWSATSGESDLIDIRAERLCDPAGGAPTESSTGYEFDGTCTPMYERTDRWLAKPTAAGQAPPTIVEAHVERTVHGPVVAKGTVGGVPVAFTSQRTSFGAELDSAVSFAKANYGEVTDAASFFSAFADETGSFNWLYVDDRDLAYYHSGLYPLRASGVDPDLPSWGTGQWEWQGYIPPSEHPQALNPARGWLASWNNKPGRSWRSADSSYNFGPVHRVDMLAKRLAARVPAGGVHPSDVVRMMAEAATVDLRGQEVLPDVLAGLGSDAGLQPYERLLQRWVEGGAHRIDRTGDGQYDDQAAVALMDAWWPNLIHAMFDPTLDGLYGVIPMGFDDGNRTKGLGSSFQNGYFGYVQKAVRQAFGRSVAQPYQTLRCADGTAAGCQTAIRQSLADTVAALGADPSAWDANEAGDAIRYSALGLISLPPQPWQNRPTFQQVVNVTSHR